MNPHKHENNDKQFMEILKAVDKKVAPPDVTFLNQLRNQSATQFEAGFAAQQSRPWRYKIMHSKTLKWLTPLAAAAAIMITLLLWPDAGVTKVYGMADIPELLNNAKTIYIHGWGYTPPKIDEPAEIEYWFDLENGRYCTHKPTDQKHKPTHFTVCDGEYIMNENIVKPVNGEPYGEISFTKISKFYGQLEARKVYMLLINTFQNVDQVEGFKCVGQETINEVFYDIWEGIIKVDYNQNVNFKFTCWLSALTGKIGRMEMMARKNEQEWIQKIVFDQFDLDIDFPDDLFSTEPPEGYKLANAKETAPTAVLGEMGPDVEDLLLYVHIAFTLDDGSVIVCWRSEDKQTPPQDTLFQGLTEGGDLPSLPLEISQLQPFPPKDKLEFTGYHLAYTKLNNKFYEWSIYIPNQNVPIRSQILGYNIVRKFNVDPQRHVGLLTQMISEDLQINARKDFNKWVLGAMAELSENGQAPAGITYDRVLDLAQQLRQRQSGQ